MGDAEEGFVVLVHIPIGGGLLPYREVYLVGCSTSDEAEARIKGLYPSELDIRLYVSPLHASDTKGFRLARNEVRPWQNDPHQTP
jgi:hypothetical protein